MKNFLRVFLFMLLAAVVLSGCTVSVPRPAVTEGRFDFSVTYEVNGEEKTISGVYVCKFVKATASLNGLYREWDGYIEGSDIEDENRYEILTNEDGVIYLDLGLDPMYLMSDPFYFAGASHREVDGIPVASFMIVYHDEISQEMGGFSVDPTLLESYGVKIISYEYDAPIDNIYE